MRTTPRIVLFTLLLSAVAAPSWAQGTYTAASCNQSDVNAVINGPKHTAVDGDTINIPAGSCAWTSGITVSGKGISLIGAGQGSTVITHQFNGALITMNPQYGNAISRISSMSILPNVASTGAPILVNGTCTVSGCPNLRIDHLTVPSSWAAVSMPDQAFAFVSNVFGVADHNAVGDVKPTSGYLCFLNIGHGSWQGVGAWGDKSWAAADTFGTQQTFYLENNTFVWALATDTDIGGSTGGGARFACRFNTFNPLNIFGGCTVHGTDTTGRARGGRQWEVYYNTGNCQDSSSGCGDFAPGRSGVGMSFSNTFTNSGAGFLKGVSSLNPQRTWRNSSPWGYCDGLSPWDTNDGTVYYSGTIASVSQPGGWTITPSGSPGWTTNQWAPSGGAYSFHDVTGGFSYAIASNTSGALTTQFNFGGGTPAAGHSFQILRAPVCMDQPTRGAGTLLTGTTPTPSSPVSQALDPTYEAADSLPATANHTIGSAFGSIIPNRDYYAESVNQAAQTSATSPFNGTSGAGHGTLARRPTTCTTGVGYWATDQGSWNTSGTGGQGQLFVCSATHTWTLYYTPYTYPHPLTQGTEAPPPPPPPPAAPAPPTSPVATRH